MTQTRRQAIAETRACADALIEQAERFAKGWDVGRAYRQDDTLRLLTIAQARRLHVEIAFNLSRQFASAYNADGSLTDSAAANVA